MKTIYMKVWATYSVSNCKALRNFIRTLRKQRIPLLGTPFTDNRYCGSRYKLNNLMNWEAGLVRRADVLLIRLSAPSTINIEFVDDFMLTPCECGRTPTLGLDNLSVDCECGTGSGPFLNPFWAIEGWKMGIRKPILD